MRILQLALATLTLTPGLAIAEQGADCRSQIRSVRQTLEAGQPMRDGGKGPSSQAHEEPQALSPDQRQDVLRLVEEAETYARNGNEGRCTTAVQSAETMLSSTANSGVDAEGADAPAERR
ncbi:hypothetical protein [Arenibaculum pallidiluteum]|uniref:hypothetical protein n=1 Tax=Arenibaculum pallidiluteum TaxID=2812559 RepID=UPI001A96814C|nr:hypothetical protein [Arenibaculum pallidiluteum]